MDKQRRAVVKGLTAASFTALTACGGSSSNPARTNEPGSTTSAGDSQSIPGIEFNHGVASGDPLSDRVILWTRVTPTESLPRDVETVPVLVTVARDRDMREKVGRFSTTTGPEQDFCVKMDVTGLQPDTWYYYQFAVGQQVSMVGRTRTFPAAGMPVERARFAVVSCSNYAFGLFSVYKAVSEQSDLDFILHLGDYIYEYGPGEYGSFPGRDPLPAHEILTLSDYRQRHAQYKTDTNLQAVHQQFPMICVWDDHESANDSYRSGAENHDEATEGAWTERRGSAVQAYFEWLPIREVGTEKGRIWRQFEFGGLIDLFMLDTRLEGRDLQASSPSDPARFDEERRIMSDAQMNWLVGGLSSSRASWRIIGQQVMFAELNIVRTLDAAGTLGMEDLTTFNGQLLALNVDQWDGYVADREVILRSLAEESIDNTVFFTGDIHTSWANEVYADSGNLLENATVGPLAAEFVTPSVTSPGFPEEFADIAAEAVKVANSHMKYVELKSPGFILVDVTAERTQAEFLYVRSISSADQLGEVDPAMTKVVGVDDGNARIYEDRPRSQPRAVRTALFHPPVRNAVS
ncbi:alkaline phosphatase D family protein [Marinobacter sp. TBZ242]|uniref:Alkaline phosphatase D family protein n=1 Tax=Marinobacter azerbaijanicus TaxID=3050455 RepID=A0ABT7IGF7_9GAMM|nr:alkaline phosphatase D family protein [Marinobacter sp. TBZ242]MDL0432194.1 alkaline phosphatase D family protein [Marinobacter sp. TBZ242]